MEHGERRRFQIALFIAGNVLFATGLIFHAFLYNFYIEALGLSADVMGHAASFLTAGSLTALIPAGLLADRVGPRATLLIGAVVLAVGLALGAVAATPVSLWGAAAVAGAGSGFWRVAMAPVLMRLTTPESRARAFAWNVGLLAAWNGAGVAMAGAASAALEARWGLPRLPALRATLLLGAVGSAASLLLYRRLHVTTGGPAAAPSTASSEVTDPETTRTILPLIALLGVWMVGPALATQFFNIFFAHVHRLSIERIGFVFAAASLCWAVVVLASGEVASRVGVGRVLFATLLAFAPAIWGLSLASSVELAVALYFVQGLISPLATPLIDQWLLGQTPPARQGAVSSWRQVAADVSAMIGASVGGWLLAAGPFGPLFLVAGAIALIGALGVVLGARIQAREPVAAQPDR